MTEVFQGAGRSNQSFADARPCYGDGMLRVLNVVYLVVLLALVLLGFVWDASTGVKALVGVAVMAPVAVAIFVTERRRRADQPNNSVG